VEQWAGYADPAQWTDLHDIWKALPQSAREQVVSIVRTVAQETARRFATEGDEPRGERAALVKQQWRVARQVQSSLGRIEKDLTTKMKAVLELCEHGQRPAIRKRFPFRPNGTWGRTWRKLDRILQAVEIARLDAEKHTAGGGAESRRGRYPVPAKNRAIAGLERICGTHLPPARVPVAVALLLWLGGSERSAEPHGESMRVRALKLRQADK
jgi:hypothetical protein